jgi:AraC-like DNA-binding protein
VFRQYLPHHALRPFVDALWICRAPPGGVVVPPDGCADLVWTGEALVFLGPTSRPGAAPGGTFAGVRFRPGGASALLGFDLDDLGNQAVAAVSLGMLDGSMEARLFAAPCPLTVLENALLAHVPSARAASVAAVLEVPPQSVTDLAAILGVPGRSLHRSILRQTGLPPKRLLRILRFQRVLRLRTHSPSLADLAAACGYADQAHMTREVTAFAGVSPSVLNWSPDWPFCSRQPAAAGS